MIWFTEFEKCVLPTVIRCHNIYRVLNIFTAHCHKIWFTDFEIYKLPTVIRFTESGIYSLPKVIRYDMFYRDWNKFTAHSPNIWHNLQSLKYILVWAECCWTKCPLFWSERSACAARGCWHKRSGPYCWHFFLLSSSLFFSLLLSKALTFLP